MSDQEGIDQNGGVPEQQNVAPATSTPEPNQESVLNDTAQSDLDTHFDNSESDILMVNTDSVLDDSQLVSGSETDQTIEDPHDVTEATQEENSNQSRELKSLLALSKEANLDTNILRKRKKVLPNRKTKNELRIKGSKIQYPVTAESELEMELHNSDSTKPESVDDTEPTAATSSKSLSKRKKSVDESSLDEGTRKGRKSFTSGIVMFKPNKDMFCWRCHKDGVNIACETCPRSYHQKCLKQTITDPDHWPCPECVAILKAESTNSRSPAMRGMTLEHLCSLLKFAVRRMIKCPGSEPFMNEVNDSEFPEYKKYIIQPMDLSLLQSNIKENLYGSTQAFETDAKWILHNSIVFNSYQSKLTTAAKSIMKICKQEMSEIENCPNCYLNANTKRKTWFVEVCPKPHLLVWAKLRGFPYWPAKTMKCKDGMVDVRFFGAHDRAWVPEKECFLYTPKDPNLFRVKRADIEQCIEELKVHVENLKKVYGEFTYPPFKTQIDPEHETKQLQMFLPNYNSSGRPKNVKSNSTDNKEGQQSEGPYEVKRKAEREQRSRIEDESMEGYGTDDESVTELDTELRENLLKLPIKSRPKDNIVEADDDDTQVPANVEPDGNSSEEIVLTKLKKTQSTPVPSMRRSSEPKINHLDISEDMEISLGNTERALETVSSSNSECSSDFSVELRKRPVQVDVDNVEYTISPASKLKITDKLIKRLSDSDCGEGSSAQEKVDRVKRSLSEEQSDGEADQEPKAKLVKNDDQCVETIEKASSEKGEELAVEIKDTSETVNWTVKDVSPKADNTKIVIKAVRIADRSGELMQEDKSVSKVDNGEIRKPDAGEISEELTENEMEPKCKDSALLEPAEPSTLAPPSIKIILHTVKKTRSSENAYEDGDKSNTSASGNSGISSEKPLPSAQEENVTVEDAMEIGESPNLDLNIDATNILNIIHSSLTKPGTSALVADEEPSDKSLKSNCKKAQKRKKSYELDERALETQNKVLKIVSVESIMNKANNNEKEDGSSLLRTSLQAKKIQKRLSSGHSSPASSARSSVHENVSDEIKSEPDCETGPVQDMEAKKKYLSALNILEKGLADVQKTKPNEIRTRSKTEEKREKIKASNEAELDKSLKASENVGDDHGTNVKNNISSVSKKKIVQSPNSSSAKSDVSEIYVKSFAKLSSDTVGDSIANVSIKPRCKQTARKSFPCPNYPKSTIRPAPPLVSVSKPQAISTASPLTCNESLRLATKTTTESSPITPITSVITSVTSATKSTLPQLQQLDAMRTTNGYLILQPQQQQENLVFLPPNHTISYTTPLANIANQVVSMGETLAGTIVLNANATLSASKKLLNGVSESKGVPSSSETTNSTTLPSPVSNQLVNTDRLSELVSDSVVPTVPMEPILIADGESEDVVLPNGIQTDVSRTLNELLRRQLPRLKPRPPGALSQQFSEGIPDSAGPIATKINSIAHRLADYFRGMLIETLEDLSKSGVSEATVATMKLENETLKHRHSVEIAEIENNANTVVQDLQRSIAEEKERIVEETRAACEAETIRRVEEAKSKQWCASCSKEAQFYCCWNTSYCDYPCQQKHWPSHMSKCTQNVNQPAQVTPATAMRPAGGQQLILRPANPPNKGTLGRVFTKPVQKVYMNRSLTQPKAMRVQTTAGNLLTMMETTPGNYQLVTTSPIMKPGTSLATIQPGLISVTSSANHQTPHTNLVPKPSTMKLVGHNMPVTTVMEEDSD